MLESYKREIHDGVGYMWLMRNYSCNEVGRQVRISSSSEGFMSEFTTSWKRITAKNAKGSILSAIFIFIVYQDSRA